MAITGDGSQAIKNRTNSVNRALKSKVVVGCVCVFAWIVYRKSKDSLLIIQQVYLVPNICQTLLNTSVQSQAPILREFTFSWW